MPAILQFLFAVALAAGQPPAPQTSAPAPPLIRCTLLPFRSAARPEGADVTLIVVSDGRPCAIPNWGVPVERRNPATAATISVAPKHGKAVFISPRMEYTADPGYAGEDEFAYEATVTDSIGADVVLRFRVKADVRAAPFAPPPSLPPAPVRVGGNIPPPQKTKDVRPVYPAEAMQGRAQGVVVIEATIGANGRVRDTVVRRSIPLLDQAAVDAVRQWEFTPTLINGVPTPVVMTVSVSFGIQSPVPPAAGNVAPPFAVSAAPATVASPSAVTIAPPVVPASFGRNMGPDFERGRQALERRQYEEALKAFRQASDAAGQKCVECFYAMAKAYEGLGASRNAVSSCDRALDLAASDTALTVLSRQTKGVALQTLAETRDQNRLREAELEFRAALALDPDAPFLHFNLGVVLMQEHRDPDGIEELKRELSIRPKSIYSDQSARLIANPRRAREAYAPDFSITTLSREFLELGDLHGKVVVLDFWGTWCPPCVQAVPWLRDLQKKHAKDPLVMIGISSDSDERVLRDFRGRNQMEWPEYWDRDRKFQQTWGIRAWPTYVVIDDEGIIRFRSTGTGEAERSRLEDAIKRQLKIVAARQKANAY
jgi:TonB family protein